MVISFQSVNETSDRLLIYVAVVELLQNGPVVLTHHSKPKAVMISPQEWDKISIELQMLKAYQEFKRVEATSSPDNYVTDEELTRDIEAKAERLKADSD